MPPLRERKDEIVGLAEKHIAKWDTTTMKRSLAPSARAALVAHPWPGNLRQLGVVIDRAVLLTGAPEITAQDLFGVPGVDG